MAGSKKNKDSKNTLDEAIKAKKKSTKVDQEEEIKVEKKKTTKAKDKVKEYQTEEIEEKPKRTRTVKKKEYVEEPKVKIETLETNPIEEIKDLPQATNINTVDITENTNKPIETPINIKPARRTIEDISNEDIERIRKVIKKRTNKTWFEGFTDRFNISLNDDMRRIIQLGVGASFGLALAKFMS